MKPAEILELLERDDELRKFVVLFHERLALDNPGREVAAALTDEQRVMDAFGRLLVGDEVCAAIAADGTHLFVSSNLDNHSPAQAQFLLDCFFFTANADGSRVSARGRVKASFLLDDGTQHILPDPVDFYFGEYEYRLPDRKLVLIPGEKPKFEIPYSKHCIDNYPLPIGFSFDPKTEISLDVMGSITPGNPVELRSVPGTESHYFSRLDPLFGRSAVVFSHLGLLCSLGERSRKETFSQQFVRKFLEIAAKNRRGVMQQTLGWEVAKWYKLDKEKRSNMDYTKLNPKQREQRDIKIREISALEDFIETLTDDINEFLVGITEPKSLKPLVKRWEARVRERIYSNEILLPCMINDSRNYPLDRFLELISTHFRELFLLEQYVARRSTTSPNLLTYTLARIGQREMLGQDTDAMVELVDANLSRGTHAEVRLFSRFKVQEKRSADKMPYFGITQLCCACCNTLFKAHGLHYIQGSVRRAGTHGKHYPDWKLDKILQTDEVLQPFFGNKLFAYFKNLSGEVEYNGKKFSRQEWACLILQDLAALWFRATPEQLARITALGFTQGAILCDESNYPDFDIPVEKSRVEYIPVADFRRALNEQYRLEVTFIPGDGDCQFRSGMRALRVLDPRMYQGFLGNGPGGFLFFSVAEQEKNATCIVRQMIVEYMRNHTNDFLPFLVTEEGINFNTVEEFTDYMQEEGVYGNNLTLQAMAVTYNHPIIVLRPGTPINPVDVQVIPVQHGDVIDINQAIIVVYNGEDHYDVVLHEPNQPLSSEFCRLIENNYEAGVMYSLNGLEFR